jgi:hypothetical protein
LMASRIAHHLQVAIFRQWGYISHSSFSSPGKSPASTDVAIFNVGVVIKAHSKTSFSGRPRKPCFLKPASLWVRKRTDISSPLPKIHYIARNETILNEYLNLLTTSRLRNNRSGPQCFDEIGRNHLLLQSFAFQLAGAAELTDRWFRGFRLLPSKCSRLKDVSKQASCGQSGGWPQPNDVA